VETLTLEDTLFFSNIQVIDLNLNDTIEVYTSMGRIPTRELYDFRTTREGIDMFDLQTELIFSENSIIWRHYSDNQTSSFYQIERVTNGEVTTNIYFAVFLERRWCNNATNTTNPSILSSSLVTYPQQSKLGDITGSDLGYPIISSSGGVPASLKSYAYVNYLSVKAMRKEMKDNSILQIECTIWDLPSTNGMILNDILSMASINIMMDSIPVPDILQPLVLNGTKRITPFLYKNHPSSVITLLLNVDLSYLLQTAQNKSRIYVGLYFSQPDMLVRNSNSTRMQYQMAAHITQNVIIPIETTYLPSTTWSVVSLGCLYVLVVLVIMGSFSVKFYEKLVKQQLTTFDELSEADLICFPCSLWFSLFGNKSSRGARQLQLLIPALLILGFGIIMACISAAISLHSSVTINCCRQRGARLFQNNLKGLPNALYTMNFEYNGPNTYCLSGSSPIVPSSGQIKPTTIAAFSAELLCFDQRHQRVMLRGRDSIGTVGSLTAGLAFIISFILIMTLLIELFLSTWYCERTFGPRLLYHLTNE